METEPATGTVFTSTLEKSCSWAEATDAVSSRQGSRGGSRLAMAPLNSPRLGPTPLQLSPRKPMTLDVEAPAVSGVKTHGPSHACPAACLGARRWRGVRAHR